MKHTLTSKAAELMRKNGRHRRWRRAFSGMAAVVVFITTYMLILPAITMENQAICGMAEHTHTDACYEMQLVCTQEETSEGADVHVHGPECYEQQQVLTCTKQEGEGHTHTDACYGYVCGQEESAGHTHTDACYTEVTHRELTCTESESAGHTHGDGCYDEEGNLVCGQEESAGHTHSDSCYTETVTRELTCGQEESSGHTHTDACIGLICGQEEYEGHTHTDACYTTEDVLVCTEPTGHTHGDSCYEKVLVCDIPEHTHTEACYPASEPEEPQEPELICTIPEHSHEDACYDADGNLICGLEEHTHTEECYAPVEIPEEETPTTAFPEEIPEGYVEYTFDNEAGLTVTAYAPEGAFGQDVQLFAEVLPEDSEEYAQAKENLDKAENAPEYTGMAAMDIRFVDAAAEDPAQAEEIEPDAEMGQVFVKIDAQALLPEDVDESTLAVQHHAKVSDGGIFGTGIFEHTDVVVETVADSSEETGDITAVPDETALPETLPALADEPEMAEAATLEEPAAETEEAQPAAMNVEAEFAVNSFSTFTITWGYYGGSVTVHYVDESGVEIPGSHVQNVGKDTGVWVSLKDYAGTIDGYELKEYRYGSSFGNSTRMAGSGDNPQIRYSGSRYYYRTRTSDNNGTQIFRNTYQQRNIYLVYSQQIGTIETVDTISKGITINLFDYTSNINGNHTLHFGTTTSGNPDYNRWTGHTSGYDNAVVWGIVQNQLITDGNGEKVPKLNVGEGESLAYLFPQDTTSGVNSVDRNLNYLFTQDEDGYYSYDSSQNAAVLDQENKKFIVYNQDRPNDTKFMPYNSFSDSSNDFLFGMTVEFDFLMPQDGKVNGQDMVFEFAGDDDVWVFIDDVLVLDLGGIHGSVSGNINFADGTSTVENPVYKDYNNGNKNDTTKTLAELFEAAGKDWSNEAYQTHTLKFFYFERGEGKSNCMIRFNLPAIPKNTLLVGKKLTGDNSGSEAGKDILDFVSNSLNYTFEVLKTDSEGNIRTGADGKPISMIADGTYPKVDADLQPIGTVTVKDGRFSLKDGEFAQFANLLEATAGSYVVRELLPENAEGIYNGVEYEVGAGNSQTAEDSEVSGFSGFVTDVLNASTGTTRIEFNNVVSVKDLSVLRVMKQIAPGAQIPANTTFKIQVETGDSADALSLLPVGTVYYLNGEEKTVTEAGIIELKSGEAAELGIIAGTAFRVTELDAEAYTVQYMGRITDASGGGTELPGGDGFIEGTVSGTNQTAEVMVVNADYDLPIEIPLTKLLYGEGTGEHHTFNFLVEEVQDKNGTPYNPARQLPGTSITTENGYGNVFLTIGLRSSEFASIGVEKPVYRYYKVTEEIPQETGGISYDTSYYIVEVEITKRDGGVIVNSGTWTYRYDKNNNPIDKPSFTPETRGLVEEIVFENNMSGNLSITKIVERTDSQTPQGTGFRFEILLKEGDTPKSGGPYAYTITKNGETVEEGALTFGADGMIASVTIGENTASQKYIVLDHGETILIKGLPAAAQATITETTTDGYAVSWSGNTATTNDSKTASITTTKIFNNPSVTCTNTTGAVLPSTGGMGTTPFLALGTLLTLGAGMLLVQRRRKEGSDAV